VADPFGLAASVMLGEVIGAIVTAVIGDALLGWLVPNWRRPTPPPLEGMWNASLGSVAAFLSGLALTLSVLPLLAPSHGRDDDVALLILLTVAVGFGVTGGILARRTFQVSSRRHALARVGLWCARASIVLAVLSSGVLLLRMTSGRG
jgi:hypothetical protein